MLTVDFVLFLSQSAHVLQYIYLFTEPTLDIMRVQPNTTTMCAVYIIYYYIIFYFHDIHDNPTVDMEWPAVNWFFFLLSKCETGQTERMILQTNNWSSVVNVIFFNRVSLEMFLVFGKNSSMSKSYIISVFNYDKPLIVPNFRHMIRI